MHADGERLGPPTALNARERSLVEKHLPLIGMALRRHWRKLMRRGGAEAGELAQEGFLALVEAVRRYEAARHGTFPAYAMARIHFAMSAYAHECGELIRVPFITQRRRREDSDPCYPPESRLIPRMRSLEDLPRRFGERLWANETAADHGEAVAWPTVGEALRACYEEARRRHLAALKHRNPAEADRSALLDLCSRERWEIPDPEHQTPLRRLAQDTGYTVGQLINYERSFRRRMARDLAKDAVFQELRSLSRRRKRGLLHRLNATDLRQLAAKKAKGRA